jgi:acetyltransferase-like isoleucine patch superfamily enzyme
MLSKISNGLKIKLIKILHKNVAFKAEPRILGNIPYFKLPRNGSVVFGRNVTLNSDFKNSNTALTYRCKFVTGYEGKINVGDNSMFNGACVVSYKSVYIGENCQIASSTLITDTDFHPVNPTERKKQVTGNSYSLDQVKKADIFIGDNVWIGWNCTILKGVSIHDNCIVAAGSVVIAGNYPANSIIAGNPAVVVKKIAF